ncbi:MAG: hypothetical protein LBT40_12210 [Deltaproteobacteria bacterium]|jgi:hypothetical protein|nr:hypothetical protein [Deltaproteobacteria bacterium]
MTALTAPVPQVTFVGHLALAAEPALLEGAALADRAAAAMPAVPDDLPSALDALRNARAGLLACVSAMSMCWPALAPVEAVTDLSPRVRGLGLHFVMANSYLHAAIGGLDCVISWHDDTVDRDLREWELGSFLKRAGAAVDDACRRTGGAAEVCRRLAGEFRLHFGSPAVDPDPPAGIPS